MKITELLSIILYGIVGFIALIMAIKNLVSKRWIVFHEKAAAKSWESLESPMKSVILALMHVSGLGFLVVSLLLLIFPVVNYYKQDILLKFSIPAISFVYCLGLFVANYHLHKQTDSATPWKGSLFSAIAIILGMILSLF